MSLKDMFSKKKKIDVKSTKIGIGNKNSKKDSNNDSNQSLSWDEEDFLKNEVENQNLEINSVSEEGKSNLNLSTDASISEDDFFNRFGSSLENNTENNAINDLNSLSLSLDKKVSDSIDVSNFPNIDTDELELTFDLENDKRVSDAINISNFSNFTKNELELTLDFENEKKQNRLEKEEASEYEITSLNSKSIDGFEVENILEDSINKGTNKDFDRITESIEIDSKLDRDTISNFTKGFSTSSNNLDTPTTSSLDIPSVSSWNSSSLKKTKKDNNKSIFGETLSVKSQYLLFFTLLVTGVVGVGSSIYLKSVATQEESLAARYTSELWASNQKFGSSFKNTVLGLSGEYDKMIKNWEEVQSLRNSLGNSIKILENDDLNKNISDVDENFKKVTADVSFIKSQESLFKNINELDAEINKNINNLIYLVEKIGVFYVQLGATQSELSEIYALKSALENIKTSTTNILLGETIRHESILSLNVNRNLFKVTLTELYNGSSTKNIRRLNPLIQPVYNNIANNWLSVANDLDKIIKSVEVLNKAKDILKTNQTNVSNIHNELRKLLDSYNGSTHGYSTLYVNLLIASILLSLLSIVALVYVYSFEKERLSKESQNESDKNRNAILKLLNEMMPLQDGDLTQKTTLDKGSITEDISRSVNSTIESLAAVVKKIKDTSLMLKEKTVEINNVSMEMLKSTENQANSIVDTGNSIIKISKAISEISEKTKLSLITAQNSAKASTVGAKHVRDSIDSMNSINKNMVETVHLMKKVSDSSKQISEVIGLLSDITEETNILALNATVQAAKAGEAGKGFKIVADSIQELADNAAEATRRVGALIATVQTDIQSVGVAIEKTTNEVSRGVGLSENAGNSLEEINVISNELASIVQTISKDAITNADAVRKISNNMEQILKVTEENKTSTQKTTNSISDIAKISNDLGESVQSFIVR